MFTAQESCPTDSLKGTVCSETMTVCVFSGTCLTARNVLGAEGGVHRGGGAVSGLRQLKRKARSERM